MSKFTLSRRHLLRGSLGGLIAAVALPPLEAMFNGNGTAYAQTSAAPPKRLGVWSGAMACVRPSGCRRPPARAGQRRPSCSRSSPPE